MSQIDAKKIKSSDFNEEYFELIEGLGRSINPFYDQVTSILNNKGINVSDNLPFEYKSIDVEVDTNGIPKFNLSLPNSLKSFRGYSVTQVQDLTGSNTRPTGTPFVSWDINTSTSYIDIKHIAALPANIKFRLTLFAYS